MSDRLDLIETIGEIDKFSTFARMLRATNVIATLKDDGPFTIFVPTNDAFGKVPDEKMNAWLSEESQTALKNILLYHIVPGKLFAANLERVHTVEAVSGQEVRFTDKGALRINASVLQARNLEATNGMVHAIDTVLSPPAATASAAAGATPNTVVAFPTPTTPAAPRPEITAELPAAIAPEAAELPPADTRMVTPSESGVTPKLS